jgi:chaperone required for assembly of F1-ATPase
MSSLPDPIKSAQRLSAPVRQKRFYQNATAAPEEGGFTLRLDGKRAMTPGRQPISIRDQASLQRWPLNGAAKASSIDPAPCR